MWKIIAVCAFVLFLTIVLIVTLCGREIKRAPPTPSGPILSTCAPGRYTPVAEMMTTVPNATVYLVPDASVVIYQDDDEVIDL